MGKGACPERILGNAIHGLVFGLVGGAVYVGANGIMKGQEAKATLNNIGRQAPLIGVQVCVLVAIYSTINCFMKAVRGKDDLMNSMLSGGVTGALFGARNGAQSTAVNATIGALLAAVSDG